MAWFGPFPQTSTQRSLESLRRNCRSAKSAPARRLAESAERCPWMARALQVTIGSRDSHQVPVIRRPTTPPVSVRAHLQTVMQAADHVGPLGVRTPGDVSSNHVIWDDLLYQPTRSSAVGNFIAGPGPGFGHVWVWAI